MKKLSSLKLVLALAVCGTGLLPAQTLTWDINAGQTGVQNGSGTWNTSIANWLNAANDNVTWANTGLEVAQFGSLNPVSGNNVSIAGPINLAGLNFLALGAAVPASGTQYTLNGAVAGTVLNFGEGGVIQLADHSSGGSQFVSLGSSLVLQGSNLTIKKSSGTVTQFINLNGLANPNLTGTLTVGSYVYVGIGGPGTVSSLSGITVQTNGTLTIGSSGGEFAMPITAAGYLNTYAAIRVTGNNTTFSGGITMSGPMGILMHSSNTGLVINSPITDGGANHGFYKFSLTKNNGTMTLAAANTYGGKTTLGRTSSGYTGGITILDYSATTSPTTDILYHGLPSAGGLDLIGSNIGSSMLILNGKVNMSNSQRLGNVSVTGLRSAIEVNSGSGGTMDLSLGTISRTGGAMLALAGPANGVISTTMADGFLGPWATYRDGSGVSAWAQVKDGKVARFIGSVSHSTGTPPNSSASSHFAIGTASTGQIMPTGTISHLATVSMADSLTERSLLTGEGNTLRLGAVGGIQIASDAKNLTVGTPGTTSSLSAGGASAGTGQLYLSNLSTTSRLTIHSGLINNAGGGAVALYVNGAAESVTVLAGAGSYTGGTTIASGSVELRNAAALGSTGTITVLEGGALRLPGGINFTRPLTLSGVGVSAEMEGAVRNVAGNNTLGGLLTLVNQTNLISDAGTLTIDAGGPAISSISGAFALILGGQGDVVVGGRIATSSGTLTKTGAGTVTLAGDNTFTGAVTVNGGALRLAHANALGTAAATVVTTVNAGAALELMDGITLAPEVINLNSTGVNLGGGIRNVSGTNTLTGIVSLIGATTRIHSDSGKLIFDSLSGAVIQQPSSSSRVLVFGGAGDIDIKDPIVRTSTGAFTVQKEGVGTVMLGAPVSNTITIVNAGVLEVNFGATGSPAANLLYNGAASPGDITFNSGTLRIKGKSGAQNSQSFNTLTVTGASSAHGGSSYLDVVQNDAAQVNLTFGNITRGLSGTLGVTLPETGTLTTTGGSDNSILLSAIGTPFLYSLDSVNGDEWLGATAISGGVRQIVPLSELSTGGYTASTAVALSGNANIAAGVGTTTLSANTTVTSLRFAQAQETLITQDVSGRTLYVPGILVSSSVGAFTQTISTSTLRTPEANAVNDLPIIQNNTAAPLVVTSTIPNQVANATTVVKAGPGTLVLRGANTYSGSTRVHEGVLHLQAGSISSNTEFLLGSGDKSGKIVLGVNNTAYNTTVDWLQVMGSGTDNRIVGGATVVSTLTVDNVTANNNFRAGFLGGPGVNENNLALSVFDVATVTTPTTLTTMLLPLGGANTYGGLTQIRNATVEAAVIANKGSASSFGTGAINDLIELGSGGNSTVFHIIGGIRYVGSSDATTDRPVQLANSVATAQSVTAVIENNGTGTLKFTAPFTSTGTNTTATRLLRLTGTNAGANEIVSVGDNGARPTVLEKAGAGTWIITGTSSHSGGTNILDGRLQVGSGGGSGSLGGSSITLGSAASILSTNRSGRLTLAHSITGSGSLWVANVQDGVTRLTSNANTWSGGTRVSGGVLLAMNTDPASSATGSGGLLVEPGAVLGGSGRVAPGTGNSILIIAGTLVIGDSEEVVPQAANLMLETSGDASLSLLAGSVVAFDLVSGASSGDQSGNTSAADRLTVKGKVVLGTDMVLRVANPNGMTEFSDGDAWRLFDWYGLDVSGRFAGSELPALPQDLMWNLDSLYSDGVLRVTVVPEPGRALLLLAGGLLLSIGRQRARIVRKTADNGGVMIDQP